MRKEYIGDAVYVDHGDLELILTTEDGLTDTETNRIVLDPEVWVALKDYVIRLESEKR